MMKKTITATEILLPNSDDLNAFAVVACDQFTSDGNYWETLSKHTDGKLSMLNMILPEYYLSGDTTEKIKVIDKNIQINLTVLDYYSVEPPIEPIENRILNMYGVDTIEFEDPKEFTQHYCHNCGSQRCEGVGTEWFEGCGYKEHLKDYEKFYG